MFKLEDCFPCMANRGIKVLMDDLDGRLIPYGLTRVQWCALYYIDTCDTLNQNQLAQLMGSKQPTIAKLLDRMESSFLIERVKIDKRTNYLKLTEKGRDICHRIAPVIEEFKNNAIEGIDAEQLIVFETILNQMVQNITKL